MQPPESDTTVTVHGTRIIPGETRAGYREKIARITLDSMVQFVGLLDAHGTVLEINKVALDAVGVELAEVEGRPFWTTFWWQVSPEINQGIRDAIARAAKGEFVRWDTPIYGRSGGTETIIIDASVMPVKDERGEVVFLVCEGRDSFAARDHAVVLLDLGMPEMDGYDVARVMRSRFPEHGPTIIALTGRGQPEDRRMAREAGIDHHLVKPAKFEVLRDLLSDVLAARGEGQRS
jgi:PAS domain S-box-containing protein